MTQIVLTLALIFIVYFIGYYMGRKAVVDEVRRMTKELKELEERNNDATKM